MIGVFDSGVGGLSVHRTLVERLPQADFIYLADQANTPYGGRPSDEIVALTRAGCIRLFEEGASLIVLACNTAAAIALRPLQSDWLPAYRQKLGRPINVIGLIVPTIEAATGLSWKDTTSSRLETMGPKKTIGIFATPATVRSQVYEVEIHKRRPDITVFQEPCPELAHLIETGADHEHLRGVIESHVKALCAHIGDRPWEAILGCTHYDIVSDLFAHALPSATKLIHQPSATADALIRYLAHHAEYDSGHTGKRRFITTGVALQSKLAEEFWNGPLAFETLLAA